MKSDDNAQAVHGSHSRAAGSVGHAPARGTAGRPLCTCALDRRYFVLRRRRGLWAHAALCTEGAYDYQDTLHHIARALQELQDSNQAGGGT
eukprot:3311915-Rhodomonas_salina.2